MHKARRLALLALGILAANVLFFGFTSPLGSPSLLLVVAFVFIVIDLVGLWYVILVLSRTLVGHPKGRLRRPVLVIAALSAAMAALQSIGQLTLRDLIALAALTVVFWFYVAYLRPARS